jgi:hypothetical protein
MIINQKIYFSHVPRTGGRFIKNTLIQNNHDVRSYFYNAYYREKEIPHLTYPEYEQFLNYIPLKSFAVVREPVDRFISMIKHNWTFNEAKINKMFRTQEDFNQTINGEILNASSNWYVPQINFINYDTKIWKFEDGFGEKWVEWMMNNFELKITEFPIKEKDYAINNISLNKDKIQYIKNYYYKDYKLLNY